MGRRQGNDFIGNSAALQGDTIVVSERRGWGCGDPLPEAGAANMFESGQDQVYLPVVERE